MPARFHLDDTIAALASAAGPAPRGILRLSGPQTFACVDAIFQPLDDARWQQGKRPLVHPGTVSCPRSGGPIPVWVWLWPTTRSYTGQPLAEIHAPGSPPLLEALLAELFEQGARPAAPGEFTLRAFLAGRIDLVQAEAVIGIIEAADEERLKMALGQLAGGISQPIAAVRSDLLDLLADLEAGLDFVDEDLEFVSRADVAARLAAACRAVAGLLDRCRSRFRSDARRRIVLAGLPNAGKSTLFNRLLGRDASLVASIPGTTRDYLRGEADWCGLSVELVDTPGWDRAETGIMHDAGRLGRDQWERADLVVWCSACDATPFERSAEAPLLQARSEEARPLVRARTKADLADRETGVGRSPVELDVSAVSGAGVERLIEACVAALADGPASAGELVGATAARCRESLAASAGALERAAQCHDEHGGEELVALEVREAVDHLGRILGAVYTDDVLDRIFSRFCIGK
jgi:tRNA modification GTPase